MGFGTYYAFTMGATSSSASVNLQRAFYDPIYLQIPTMASASALDVYGSIDGTNYYQLRKPVPNTTTVQSWTFTVAASAGANGGIVPIPGGLKYYKIIATDSAPTAALGFNIICGND